MVQQIVPPANETDLTQVLQRVIAAPSPEPFSDQVIDFCSNFSRSIFKSSDAARYPELQALAFWMRKAELVRLREEFAALAHPRTVVVPRGVVFHIPPSNVDTIFIYSWLSSVLTGNRNILRLSPRPSPQTEILCQLFNDLLATSDPAFQDNTVMLRYGHEREITAAISAVCDLRVIWGGDATVNQIRTIPLAPHARDLTFPDRYSFAVIDAHEYLVAGDRAQLAERFYNDTFWFDQMACSSPRLVVWRGAAADAAEAGRDFFDRVAAHADRKEYEVHPATRLQRFTFACRAVLDDHASSYQDLSKVVVLGVDDLEMMSREHCGGGLLFQYRAENLRDLSAFVGRRDQTMTYFGLDPDELKQFAASLQGRGVDRMVPMGQALNFHRFWDGYDLLAEFTRRVYIGT